MALLFIEIPSHLRVIHTLFKHKLEALSVLPAGALEGPLFHCIGAANFSKPIAAPCPFVRLSRNLWSAKEVLRGIVPQRIPNVHASTSPSIARRAMGFFIRMPTFDCGH
jgi:hypothetical protein